MAIRIAGVMAAAFLFAPLAEAASKVQLGDAPKISLPYVEGTKQPKADGPARITLLFAEKKPENVVLVNAFGSEDLSLNQWAAESKTVAVKISFTEGDEENYSLEVHRDGEVFSAGSHHSGDGIRGVFKKITHDGAKISGTIQHEGLPSPLSGTFDTTLTVINELKWVKGPAVAKSPQGKVLLAYAAAARKGDHKTMTKYSVRDEVEESKRTAKMMGKDFEKKMIEMEFKTAKEFEKLLSSSDASMAESGDMTKIKLTHRMGGSTMGSTISLMKVKGVWKVSW